MIADVTRIIPLALKHRVDGDTLVKLINDVESRGSREGILSFKNKSLSGMKRKNIFSKMHVH